MSDEFWQENALQTVEEVACYLVLHGITAIWHELNKLGAHKGQDILKLSINQSLDQVFWKPRLPGFLPAIQIFGSKLHLIKNVLREEHYCDCLFKQSERVVIRILPEIDDLLGD
jgi:hypothetical protein